MGTNQNQYDKQQEFDRIFFKQSNLILILFLWIFVYFNQLLYLLWFNNYEKRKENKLGTFFVYRLFQVVNDFNLNCGFDELFVRLYIT